MARMLSRSFLILCLALFWAGESVLFKASLKRDEEAALAAKVAEDAAEDAAEDTVADVVEDDLNNPQNARYAMQQAEGVKRRQEKFVRKQKAIKMLKKEKRLADYNKLQENLAKEKAAQGEAHQKRQLDYEREVTERKKKKEQKAKAEDHREEEILKKGITLRLTGPASKSMILKVPLGQHLGAAAEKAAKAWGMPDINKVRLFVNGKQIKRGDTAAMQRLQSGATMTVMQAE
mmetsp:Transcript_67271/g.179186  ORF Transcript_67271/g.179186 Transcript_67271/m.179186 type:complete len:233 (-) Transcript_67271:107-805(-)